MSLFSKKWLVTLHSMQGGGIYRYEGVISFRFRWVANLYAKWYAQSAEKVGTRTYIVISRKGKT